MRSKRGVLLALAAGLWGGYLVLRAAQFLGRALLEQGPPGRPPAWPPSEEQIRERFRVLLAAEEIERRAYADRHAHDG